jgi:hypothetical protein
MEKQGWAKTSAFKRCQTSWKIMVGKEIWGIFQKFPLN